MAYIIILPDPDWRHRCRHRGGDPDCSCFPECPECGTVYTPTDGHDCLDDVPADELLDAAKELRDALDACETERDRLRAQLAALQSVPQGVEVPELTDAFLDLACGIDLSGKADLHSAAFRDLSRLQYRRGWEDLAARLVPTPPQDATGAQITFSQPETSPYLICDHCGGEMALTDGWVPTYSNPDNQGCNPSAEPYCPKCDAPHPLQPEERRVGPDEVVVSREEWEVIEQILKASAICANEGGTDRHCCMQTDDHHIPLTRIRAIRALRTSAQAHNGEESK
jgi:hypothetical protein